MTAKPKKRIPLRPLTAAEQTEWVQYLDRAEPDWRTRRVHLPVLPMADVKWTVRMILQGLASKRRKRKPKSEVPS